MQCASLYFSHAAWAASRDPLTSGLSDARRVTSARYRSSNFSAFCSSAAKHFSVSCVVVAFGHSDSGVHGVDVRRNRATTVPKAKIFVTDATFLPNAPAKL